MLWVVVCLFVCLLCPGVCDDAAGRSRCGGERVALDFRPSLGTYPFPLYHSSPRPLFLPARHATPGSSLTLTTTAPTPPALVSAIWRGPCGRTRAPAPAPTASSSESRAADHTPRTLRGHVWSVALFCFPPPPSACFPRLLWVLGLALVAKSALMAMAH